jgi:hypothetical protein
LFRFRNRHQRQRREGLERQHDESLAAVIANNNGEMPLKPIVE